MFVLVMEIAATRFELVFPDYETGEVTGLFHTARGVYTA
jgi:hypothetical protein